MSEKDSNCQHTGISRRRFIRDTGIVTTALASSVILSSCQNDNDPPANTTSTGEAEPVKVEVFDPFGPLEITQLFAPRLDTLEGKTIAYSEGTWMVGTAKPLVLGLLQDRYPTLKVVDIPEYGPISQMSPEEVNTLVKDLGVDAVIVGNAG